MNALDLALEYKHGSGPDGSTRRLHRQHGYVSPDAFYEAALIRLVQPGTRWLDAGCGRSPCPHNPRLAQELAGCCQWMAGVDPGPNLPFNPYLHRAIAGSVAAAEPDGYTLVTLRMAAEHLADPEGAAAALRRVTEPGGTLLIYTVDALSPTALAGRLGTHGMHVRLMRRLFGGEARDVFPAYYGMNSRSRLRQLLTGFEAVSFAHLDDCRLTARWPWLHAAELTGWRVVQALGLPYPERCILAEYRRTPEP